MKIRNLFEASKTAVLAFGRMNPPTIGHKKLADKVASIPGDPYIFVTQSQKPKTDPLAFADKLKFAQASFPNVKVGSSDVKTIIQALQKIEAMRYDSIVYVAGSDRIQDFTTLINKYNGKEYNFKSIQVVSAGERDPDAEGAEGMSASKMRAAAATGDFDSFQQGVANPKIAQQMYDAVRKGMGVIEDAPPGREKQVKKLKGKFDDPGAPYAIAWAQHNKHGNPKKKIKEGYKLQLERDKELLVLNITDTKTGKRTEVRGKPGYETGNYDPNDKLHMLLDKIGKSADISQLMNGEPVGINPKHPQGANAKAATSTAFNEVLDNPYPYKLEGPSKTGTWVGKANTPNGPLVMDFDGNQSQDDFSIDFAVNSKMGSEGTGDAFRIFATVVAIMNEWISKVGIERVVSFDFNADKDEHDSDGRSRLYTRYANKLASQLGWSLRKSEVGNGSADFFTLQNPNPQTNENFADGKKKGKSRPGRVKKSGASCNGSVTALRKRAKNASGEKAKMYHWCANMKSGRKKK